MTLETHYCVECGIACTGDIRSNLGEPLCKECGDDLGYTEDQPVDNQPEAL